MNLRLSAPALLYRLRIKVLLRYFTAGDSRKRWQYGFGVVFGVIAFCVALFFALALFRFLLTSGEAGGPALAETILSATFNITVVILTVTGLAVVLYTLYLSDDLEILSATPIKERTIFSYKFLETLFTNSLPFLFLALPISVAFGIVASGSAVSLMLFLLIVPVLSVLLLSLPTALCILFSMPLMRVLPASRAKEIVAGVGAIFGAALYLVYLLLIGPDPESGSPDVSGGAVSVLRPALESSALNIPPGSWVSAVLSGASSLEWGAFVTGLAPLCALCAAAYLLCLTVSGWAYSTGRAQAAESSGQVGSISLRGPVTGRLLSFLPDGIRAIASKELRILRRDFRRLASISAPVIILFGAFFVNFNGSPINSGDGPWFLPLFSYLLAVAVGCILSSLLAAYSVGAEGSAYWYIQTSPIKPADLMAGKLAASVVYGAGAALIVSVVITAASGFPSAVNLLGIALGVFGGTVAAVVGGLYGIGISAMFAQFEGEKPNQTLSQMGNFVMVLLIFGAMLAAGLAVALAFGLSVVIPAWLAVVVAALAWVGGCSAGGYVVAISGMRSLELVDQ